MGIFLGNKVLVANVNCDDSVNHFSNVVFLYCCWLVEVDSVVSMTVVVSDVLFISVSCSLIESMIILLLLL